jgi:mgtE-like transporter
VAERLSGAPARLARRAGRLLGYWRTERRTLQQGLVALVLSTAASFVAGLTLRSITGTLELLPGFLVLIPAAVGMRGTIFGAMGARLGTGIAAGLFDATLRRGGLLARNVEVAILSTVLSSFYLAVVARLVASAFVEDAISLWDLVTISVLGGILGSAVILLLTVGLALVSFRRGWDLDAVGTPMITAIGDMVTLPALFVATLIARADVANAVVAGFCAALVVGAILRVALGDDPVVRRILLEMAAIVALTPLLDIIAGALLAEHQGPLTSTPGILILIPPFVSQAGALGGILSARLSSKLQLGVITPRGRPGSPAIVDGSIVTTLGVGIFALIGAVGWALSSLTGAPPASGMALIGATLLAGLLVMPVTLVVSYYVAVLTARFGMDPDNTGVPIITSALDLAGVAAILFVMRTSGVLP